jgi:two-component system cell cycle response regulator DivK
VGQKILVVEDNELNLKLFCDLLRAHGYEAEAVRDGREAVERARAFRPELVIMDIQMPYVSGLELIEQLKADEELKRTPIMAVTAYAAKGDEERIRDAGAEGYVSKPISLMRFIEAVRGLLAAEGEAEIGDPGEEPSPRGAQATKQSSDAVPEQAGSLRSTRNDEGEQVVSTSSDAKTADASPAKTEPRDDYPEKPKSGPDGDAPEELSSETVIPAEAGTSGQEDSDVDGELPPEPPEPFTPRDPGLRRDDAGPKGDSP